MVDAFPPIHLYAVLAASAGLLAAKQSLWVCVPVLTAWAHVVGYITLDIWEWYISLREPVHIPEEVWNLAIHAGTLSLFVGLAVWAHVSYAQRAHLADEEEALNRLALGQETDRVAIPED